MTIRFARIWMCSCHSTCPGLRLLPNGTTNMEDPLNVQCQQATLILILSEALEPWRSRIGGSFAANQAPLAFQPTPWIKRMSSKIMHGLPTSHPPTRAFPLRVPADRFFHCPARQPRPRPRCHSTRAAASGGGSTPRTLGVTANHALPEAPAHHREVT